MNPSMWRYGRVLIGASAVLLLTAGLALGGAEVARHNAETPRAAATSVSSLGAQKVALPGAVYDLAYDVGRNSLWFAYMSVGGPDALYQYNIAANTTRTWALPDVEYNGFLSRVRVSSDGSIWVSQPYGLTRFDPGSNRMTSLQLAEGDPDYVADPTTAAADPFTWISTFTVDAAGRAIVGRHNVTTLIVVDSTLTEIGRIPLPKAYEGPADIAAVGQQIFVTPYLANVASTDAIGLDGAIIHAYSGAANRLLVGSDSSVLTVGAVPDSWLRPDGSISAAIGSAYLDLTPGAAIGDIGDRGAVFPGGGFVLSHRVGIAERYGADGSRVADLHFSPQSVNVLSPNGQQVTAMMPIQISAVAVDSSGRSWLVDLTDNQLISANL